MDGSELDVVEVGEEGCCACPPLFAVPPLFVMLLCVPLSSILSGTINVTASSVFEWSRTAWSSCRRVVKRATAHAVLVGGAVAFTLGQAVT